LFISAKRLVTIDCDSPVGIDEEGFRVKPFDMAKLTQLFNELGFSRLLGQMGLSPAEKPVATVIPQTLFEQAGQIVSAASAGHDYRLVDTQEKFASFFDELSKQSIFAIDTESTSIFPMRAELVGISISWKENAGFYIPVKAPIGAKRLSITSVREKLTPILIDKNNKKSRAEHQIRHPRFCETPVFCSRVCIRLLWSPRIA